MTTANGIDVSSWQHPAGAEIDWTEVAKSGIQFVMIKCSQGVGYRNPSFQSDAEGAKAAGILVGAFHFGVPAQNGAEAEAAWALESVKGVALDLGLALDLEDIGTVQPDQAGIWAQTFLGKIAEAVPLAPLYCDQNLYIAMGGTSWGYPLWIADPSGTFQGTPWMRQTGASEVTGVPTACDTDTLSNTRGANPGPQGPPAPPVVVAPPPPVVVAPEPTPEPAPVPTEPTGGDVQFPTLSVTDPGPEAESDAVKAVQAVLQIVKGIPIGPTGVDGRFGAETEAAVKTFQGLARLEQDGIVGPLTAEALFNG
jgi:lysozyme